MTDMPPTDVPAFSLISLYRDDTMRVICHWHHQPTEDEIGDMIRSLDEREVVDLQGVLIARTIAFHGDTKH